MRYYVRGERVYESTETSSRRAAERILRKRLGAADAAATPPSL